MTRRSGRIAVAIIAFSCATWPALADEATETYIKAWIESIDASPDWNASYGTINSNETVTTVTGLTVTSEKPGFKLTLQNFVLGGFSEAADGSLKASILRLDGGKVETGEFAAIDLASAEFSDVALPTTGGFVWDETRPVISVIKAASLITKVAMRSGRIGSIVLHERVDEMDSTITYEQVNIDNWASGRIESVSAGPIHSQSPSREPLTAMSIASSTSRDIDLNVLFHVLDPDSYGADGRGDMQWKPMIGSVFYRDFITAMPGVSMNIAELSADGIKLRQPENGVGILAEIGPDTKDAFEDNPKKALEIVSILTAYGIDKIDMRGTEIVAPNVDRFRLAGFTMTDISSDKLGEIAVDRLDIAAQEQGSLALRRFAIGDLVLPAIEDLVAAAEARDKGTDVDLSSVMAKIGFLEIAGLDAQPFEMPRTTLESLRIDMKDYIGAVPGKISWDLVDADVDAELIPDSNARSLLGQLGYDRVVVSSAFDATWTEDGVIDISQFRLALKDVGALYGDIRLAGIKPSDITSLRDEENPAEKLEFIRGTLNFKDDSIVGRGLAMQAETLSVDPAEFREQFASGLPFMLSFLGEPSLQGEVMPVLQQFIRATGGTISVIASPASPVPFATFDQALGEGSPLSLLRTLNISFSGLPGVTTKPEVKQPQEESPDDFWEEQDEEMPFEDIEPGDGLTEPATPSDGKPAVK